MLFFSHVASQLLFFSFFQPGSEVLNLSVGPRGLVWAVTWDGHCLVRVGVGKEKETGAYWDIVFPPDDSDHKFLQVAVGTDIVWAVARSGKVKTEEYN